MSPEETFFRSYVETALWSSTDDEGDPLDSVYTIDDIAPETLEAMRADCADFMEANAFDIGTQYERAGHDFWLTRNRHGAGFWDGDWEREAGQRLTANSHAYGSVDLYIGDDSRIYSN